MGLGVCCNTDKMGLGLCWYTDMVGLGVLWYTGKIGLGVFWGTGSMEPWSSRATYCYREAVHERVLSGYTGGSSRPFQADWYTRRRIPVGVEVPKVPRGLHELVGVPVVCCADLALRLVHREMTFQPFCSALVLQAELFLMRLTRASGIPGLACMSLWGRLPLPVQRQREERRQGEGQGASLTQDRWEGELEGKTDGAPVLWSDFADAKALPGPRMGGAPGSYLGIPLVRPLLQLRKSQLIQVSAPVMNI